MWIVCLASIEWNVKSYFLSNIVLSAAVVIGPLRVKIITKNDVKMTINFQTEDFY